ncbi:hypothetical protein EDB92DRAFT_749397 [Lactarius akahatsu]|uniref:Uncharacterized protein n=1 Tax=Lactarius akahatsu TaxID=416441 RepID=A0AAD4Q7J6_9AGAM|nr:hypothetical protein EDB92DRAFT_749397 [Lactarius akahatsu]
MFSLKTLTQAFLVASIATSSLAAVVPDRHARHEARVLPAALSKDTVDFIKETASQEAVKAGLEAAVNKIEDHFNNDTPVAVDAQNVSARAIRGLTPEIKDLIKTSAVGGLVGGATTATINGLTNLFDNKQTRGISRLADEDLHLLGILSRRLLEELD